MKELNKWSFQFANDYRENWVEDDMTMIHEIGCDILLV